jgi:L,D-transpeptidase catalytic domain
VPIWALRSQVSRRAVPTSCSRLGTGLAGLAVLAGCSSTGGGFVADGPGTPPPTRTAAPTVHSPLVDGNGLQPYGDAAWPAYAVTPRASRLAISGRPGGPTARTMSAVQQFGAPLTLLLVARRAGWLQVELPVRPNGSTGWVRATDVRLRGLRYGLELERGSHRLLLFDRSRQLRVFRVGIGTRDTPTPGGLYYLIELLRPSDPGGAYGPYAYGLSGFSAVIHHFNGGNGVIGLHGTNEPAKVGHDVSHGCIRMYNADITYLAQLLPLGTPIRIVA